MDKKVGLDWLYGFRKRHPQLSIRQPKGSSVSRVYLLISNWSFNNVPEYLCLLVSRASKKLNVLSGKETKKLACIGCMALGRVISNLVLSNQYNVSSFDNLLDILNRFEKIRDPSRIHNLNETATTTIVHKSKKVVAEKGTK